MGAAGRLASVLLVAVVFASVTGCAKLEQRFTPPPQVVTEEATVAVSGAAVTGDLGEAPQDLPVWPGATVTDQSITDGAYAVTMTTVDVYDDVLKGVAVGFERAGWSVAQEESGDQGARSAVLTVTGSEYEGYVTITEAENEVIQVDYLLSPVAAAQ